MKRVLITLGVGLLALTVPSMAEAGKAGYPAPPRILDTGRAIPTESGEMLKVIVFTKRADKVKLRAPDQRLGGDWAKRFGRGCGKLRCQKWRVYLPRTEAECFEVNVIAQVRGVRHGDDFSIERQRELTICEPFPGGSV